MQVQVLSLVPLPKHCFYVFAFFNCDVLVLQVVFGLLHFIMAIFCLLLFESCSLVFFCASVVEIVMGEM